MKRIIDAQINKQREVAPSRERGRGLKHLKKIIMKMIGK